jgi:hypothetical protein
MKQQFQWRPLPLAISLAAMMLALPTECTYARGRGGAHFGRGGGFEHGGFGRGDFSREGPAAAGSFASRSGARGAEANRMAYGGHAQASRQQEANALQSNRANALPNSAQYYHGAYPYAGLGYPAWDAGAAAAAAATGAAIGAAATAPMAAPASTSAAPTAGQPCANAVTVPVGPFTFFRCGSTWYRHAFGPAGPTFVAVGRPGR